MKKWISALLSGVLAGAMLLGPAPAQPQTAEAATADKYNMSYLYFGKTNTYTQQVEKTRGALNVVSPNYFELNDDGTLKLTRKLFENPAFIKEMHAKGIKVVPYITNDWVKTRGENALAKRVELATQIAAAIQTHNLDGVNVDFEGLDENSRNAMSDFLRVLREKIPRDKQVSIAVAANPNNWQKGWHGSYDYAKLAQYSDFLMIMAYDESWSGDPTPGPVASLPWVERSIQYALNNQVSADKIVLGVPFYGRYWKTDGSVKGRGYSNKDIYAAIQALNAKVEYDAAAQSAKATFTVKAETKVGSHTFTPGTYEIWYENDESLKAKLRLVHKYGLKGTGSWSLGQESADTWDYYSLWLNGRFYNDTAKHWAEPNILSVSERGWMNGTGQYVFSPDRKLTRTEAAVILVRALGLDKQEPAAASGFTDVPAAYWAKKEIDLAKQHGIIKGTSPTTFSPEATVTREQVAAMFTRLMRYQAEPAETSPFLDVKPESWAYSDILAMQQRGIINGVREGYFAPLGNTSRAEMATLMHRLAPEIDLMLLGGVVATNGGTETGDNTTGSDSTTSITPSTTPSTTPETTTPQADAS